MQASLLQVPCHICGDQGSLPEKFLLQCCLCKRGYHHRCIIPPVDDAVLTSLIRATNKNKPGKGLSAWKCNNCRGELEGPNRRQRAADPVVGSSSATPKAKRASTPVRVQDAGVIVISDEEEGVAPVVTQEQPARLPERRPSSASSAVKSATGKSADADHIHLTESSANLNKIGGVMEVDHPQVSISSPLFHPRLPTPISSSDYEHSGPTTYRTIELYTPKAERQNEVRPQTFIPTPPQSDPTCLLPLRSSLPSEAFLLKIASKHPPPRRLPNEIVKDETNLPYDHEKFKYVPPLPALCRKPASEGRRPRKIKAKTLDKYNKSPGQRAFTFVTED